MESVISLVCLFCILVTRHKHILSKHGSESVYRKRILQYMFSRLTRHFLGAQLPCKKKCVCTILPTVRTTADYNYGFIRIWQEAMEIIRPVLSYFWQRTEIYSSSLCLSGPFSFSGFLIPKNHLWGVFCPVLLE